MRRKRGQLSSTLPGPVASHKGVHGSEAEAFGGADHLLRWDTGGRRRGRIGIQRVGIVSERRQPTP